MRALRDTWNELVERRLWPVALLLVVALLAVPLVLAKSASHGGAGPVAAAVPATGAADAGQAAEPIVSVASGSGPGAPLRGRVKNPFVQQHLPRRAATVTSVSAPGAAGAPAATGGGGSGSGGGSGRRRSAKPAPKTYLYSTVDVHFGRAGAPLSEIKDVPRLAALPNSDSPVLIFMGTRSDHETAVFMVSTDVHTQGQVRCVPSERACEAIELRRGDVALLDVTAADGTVTQYELDLDDVALHQTTSQAKASAAYARASSAGRRLLRRSAASSAIARALRFSVRQGVLLPLAGTYLTSDASQTPQASAGAVQRPPVLMPLP